MWRKIGTQIYILLTMGNFLEALKLNTKSHKNSEGLYYIPYKNLTNTVNSLEGGEGTMYHHPFWLNILLTQKAQHLSAIFVFLEFYMMSKISVT